MQKMILCWLPREPLDTTVSEMSSFSSVPQNIHPLAFYSLQLTVADSHAACTAGVHGHAVALTVCDHSTKVGVGVCCLDTTKHAAAEGFLPLASLAAS